MELAILKLLSCKDKHTRFMPLIKKKFVTKETWTVLEAYTHYFEFMDEITWAPFVSWFFTTKHTGMSDVAVKAYRIIFNRIEAYEVDVLDENILNSLIERDSATKIMEVARSIAETEGTHGMEEIMELYDKYETESGKAGELDKHFIDDDYEALYDHIYSEKDCVAWRLPELNAATGGLRQGNFIVVGACPDSGKTTLMCNELTHIALQVPEAKYVHYFCNEEHGRNIKHRILQSALAKTHSWLKANWSTAVEDYKKYFIHEPNIKVFHNTSISTHDVETVLKKYPPALIIFDQLRKFRGFEKVSKGEVDRQALIFAWARGIAAMAPTIAVHQAGGDAYGQMYIGMEQLYNSRIGIQGEADAIITLGRSNDLELPPNMRGLYVPKNKLIGLDPKASNGRWNIEIQPEIARFKSCKE